MKHNLDSFGSTGIYLQSVLHTQIKIIISNYVHGSNSIFFLCAYYHVINVCLQIIKCQTVTLLRIVEKLTYTSKSVFQYFEHILKINIFTNNEYIYSSLYWLMFMFI